MDGVYPDRPPSPGARRPESKAESVKSTPASTGMCSLTRFKLRGCRLSFIYVFCICHLLWGKMLGALLSDLAELGLQWLEMLSLVCESKTLFYFLFFIVLGSILNKTGGFCEDICHENCDLCKAWW